MKTLVKKSTTSQRKESWKVHSAVGYNYNAVAGSMFIRLAVVASKICEIQRDSLKNLNC